MILLIIFFMIGGIHVLGRGYSTGIILLVCGIVLLAFAITILVSASIIFEMLLASFFESTASSCSLKKSLTLEADCNRTAWFISSYALMIAGILVITFEVFAPILLNPPKDDVVPKDRVAVTSNTEEERYFEALEDATRTSLSSRAALLFVVLTLYFLIEAYLQVLLAENYSYNQIFISLIFPIIMGFIITKAVTVRPIDWMGFAHFAALIYVGTLICSIPIILEFIGFLQPILFVTFIMLTSTSLILFRKRFQGK
ncbi:MAG: hypothetical protein AAF512_09250 [Pseudomonadota bacterium]